MSAIRPRDTSSGEAASATGDITPGTVTALSDDTIAALQTALAAEHAALWMYGLVAAYNPKVRDDVAAAVISHQGTRDTAANMIVGGGGTPVGPDAAYTAPEPASDPASALALALAIEADCANAWRAVAGFTDDSTLRGTALSALTECAMRMVGWRRAAKSDPITVAFPGNPQTS